MIPSGFSAVGTFWTKSLEAPAMSWLMAQHYCRSLGAALVDIDDSAEYAEVQTFLTSGKYH